MRLCGLTPPSSACWLTLPMDPQHTDKPHWIDTLEESLLLAIGLFTLITWIVMIGLLGH
jgi:hypothetical protein